MRGFIGLNEDFPLMCVKQSQSTQVSLDSMAQIGVVETLVNASSITFAIEKVFVQREKITESEFLEITREGYVA
ncbi:hypothetical protein [Chengkuizengella sediminis]|uniref:hypothetical protein n=1 Tax=Chengkuizengella sediminis TaxID=1885917 RepID=UPI00138A3751|nr:hypothetical protein [Chengkuizengella sediminis]NDI34640.1 hypothetical protein [Chengkuizengella sediminis]